ncbi:Peptidase family M28 [Amphibacillus marinus]|uniref:Peptidase family M28 n=1 Tax=Amphibacillus marinus TaxID=872970 RepID=A0A1H8PQW5_9BACI|nr:M20/M25/M40 family metallo-hydrolase [Amphibacillus marinus]SEO44107.1 Peptidase family M28 [Amphibacillus marinus]
MRSKRQYCACVITVVATIVTTIMLTVIQIKGPTQQAGDVPEEQFSVARALEHLEQIATEPRSFRSLANQEVRRYIIKQLEANGIEVEIHKKLTTEIEQSIYPTSGINGEVTNIIGKIPGESESNLIFTSHHDSVRSSPGAADAGYGVVSLLEAARAFQSLNRQPKHNLYFIFTDAEELGLLGASALAEDYSELLANTKVIVNLEARGNTGAATLFETNEGNYSIIKAAQQALSYPNAYAYIYDLYQMMNNDTDFSVYKEYGNQGLNFANFAGIETYHQPSDNVENADQTTILHHGLNTLELIEHFAFADDSALEQIATSEMNAIYFTIGLNQLVVYSENLVPILFLICLILTVLVLILALRKNKLTVKQAAIAPFILLCSFVALFVLTYLILLGFSHAFGFAIYDIVFAFDVKNKGLMLITFGLIAILYWIIILSWLTKKLNIYAIITSFLVILTFLAGITSRYLPGLSYIFLWPSVLTAIGMLPMIVNIKLKLYQYFWLVIAIAPIILVVGPVLNTVYTAMTIGTAPILVFFFSLALLSVLLASLLAKHELYHNIEHS